MIGRMRLLRRLALPGTMALGLTLAAACGGGGESSDEAGSVTETPGSTMTSVATATATRFVSPTPTRTSSPTPTPTATPTPTPTPPPKSPVQALYIGSAGVGTGSPVEVRDTTIVNGGEQFQEPSAPQYIAWYERFGQPGIGQGNSFYAAHINYVNYGNGPFAHLTSVKEGDAVYVFLEDGRELAYTVKSVRVISLRELDMGEVLWPELPANTERITLMSCGGGFVPNPSGYGGHYDSRVVLVAERWTGAPA